MMLIRQLFRYIRDGLKNIWRNLFMSISSIFTLTITLSLCSLFVLFAHNSNEFTEQLENEIKIFVEFDKVATPEQIQSTIDTIEQNSYVVMLSTQLKSKTIKILSIVLVTMIQS